MTDEKKKASQGSGWEVGVDRYRDAAKWVIAAFGAIGALIVGTIPVSRLGENKVGDLGQLTLGVGIAVGGTLLAIISALWNLEPKAIYPGDLQAREGNRFHRRFVGFRRLEHELHKHPSRFLPTGVNRFDELDSAIVNLERLAAIQANAGTTSPAAKDAAAASRERLASYRQVRRHLNGLARFELARTRFIGSLVVLILASLATVSGLALATHGLVDTPNTPEVELSEVKAEPIAIVLTPDGIAALESRLGTECVKSDVSAILLAGNNSTNAWDVVSIASESCAMVRFTLTGTLGTISPSQAGG